MTTPLEGILLKKKECSYSHINSIADCEYCHSCLEAESYNCAIDDCHAALKKAIKDGVIGWVPSEEELIKLLGIITVQEDAHDDDYFRQAKLIRELMGRK